MPGGKREGAGRPRLDKNGQTRKNHAMYCTADEAVELKFYLSKIRESEDYKLNNILARLEAEQNKSLIQRIFS